MSGLINSVSSFFGGAASLGNRALVGMGIMSSHAVHKLGDYCPAQLGIVTISGLTRTVTSLLPVLASVGEMNPYVVGGVAVAGGLLVRSETARDIAWTAVAQTSGFVRAVAAKGYRQLPSAQSLGQVPRKMAAVAVSGLQQIGPIICRGTVKGLSSVSSLGGKLIEAVPTVSSIKNGASSLLNAGVSVGMAIGRKTASVGIAIGSKAANGLRSVGSSISQAGSRALSVVSNSGRRLLAALPSTSSVRNGASRSLTGVGNGVLAVTDGVVRASPYVQQAVAITGSGLSNHVMYPIAHTIIDIAPPLAERVIEMGPPVANGLRSSSTQLFRFGKSAVTSSCRKAAHLTSQTFQAGTRGVVAMGPYLKGAAISSGSALIDTGKFVASGVGRFAGASREALTVVGQITADCVDEIGKQYPAPLGAAVASGLLYTAYNLSEKLSKDGNI